MQVKFSRTAKEQLIEVKSYIAKDSPEIAEKHIRKVINGIKRFMAYPYLGKVNAV